MGVSGPGPGGGRFPSGRLSNQCTRALETYGGAAVVGHKSCGGPPLGSPTKEVETPFQAPHLCVFC